MFEVSILGLQIFNFIIMAFIALGAIWVFLDTRKRGQSYTGALLWSVIALFLFPPIGLLIYIFYARRKWL